MSWQIRCSSSPDGETEPAGGASSPYQLQPEHEAEQADMMEQLGWEEDVYERGDDNRDDGYGYILKPVVRVSLSSPTATRIGTSSTHVGSGSNQTVRANPSLTSGRHVSITISEKPQDGKAK